MVYAALQRLRQTDWAQTALNLVFPQFCQACRARLLTEENGYFCPTCWEGAPRIEPPFCPVCGKPHPEVKGVASREHFLCGDCAGSSTVPPYGRMVGAAPYRGIPGDAVKLFKFGGRRRLAEPLGEWMVEAAQAELPCEAYDLISPVPLHRVRRRERGFNQSLLLAEAIEFAFPNAVVCEALARTRPTRVQSRIHNADERRANVAGAFAVAEGAPVAGQRVLLVDDVVTTGGTVIECARVLREAGAARVDVLAAALTERWAPGTMGTKT